MPAIKITAADIAKTRNLDPAWYGLSIVKVEGPTPSKDQKSINYTITFLVEGDKAAGKEIPFTLNSKLIGKVAPIYEACFGKKLEATDNFELESLVGKKCDGNIIQQTYNGNLIDNISAFAPYGVGRNQKAPF